ncbi:hypothetical protein ACI2OX_12440 [Bacillus sp. N9]
MIELIVLYDENDRLLSTCRIWEHATKWIEIEKGKIEEVNIISERVRKYLVNGKWYMAKSEMYIGEQWGKSLYRK